MQQEKVRDIYDLPQDQYRLVQVVKERLGLMASATLSCFFLGEISQPWGLSDDETAVIRNYAEELGVELPTERTYRMLS